MFDILIHPKGRFETDIAAPLPEMDWNRHIVHTQLQGLSKRRTGAIGEVLFDTKQEHRLPPTMSEGPPGADGL